MNSIIENSRPLFPRDDAIRMPLRSLPHRALASSPTNNPGESLKGAARLHRLPPAPAPDAGPGGEEPLM